MDKAVRKPDKQRTFQFDFEFAAVHAAKLKAEIDRDEEVRHVESPTPAIRNSGQRPKPGNNAGSLELFQFELPGVENSRPLGLKSGKPITRTGKQEQYYSLFNDNFGTTGDRTGGTGQGHVHSTAATGAYGTGNTESGRNPNFSELTLKAPALAGHVIEPAVITAPLDYRITQADQLGHGGAKQKFRDNIEAIKLVKALQDNEVPFILPDRQKILLRYVGWGGLPQAFDPQNVAWKKEYDELRKLLDYEEYRQARRSTQDAHYTSYEVIQGIYQGLSQLGFDGNGQILEPSAGTGNFLGLKPESWGDSHVTAIELDPITAAIGKYLYPNADYINKGFQDVIIPENHFDLAIGNPPFGSQKIYDASRPDLSFSIHNYFMAKSLDSVREGGLAAFVVSRYFMDAQNKQVREYIAAKANLVGAIRLPNTAFRQNALTDVTTDIVFFQKTGQPQQNPNWLNTGEITDAEGNAISINQFYIDNPGQMAGYMARTQNMFKESADLLPSADFKGLAAEISQRLEFLPRNIYQSRQSVISLAPQKNATDLEKCASLKTGSLFITVNGKIGRKLPSVLDKADFDIYQPTSQIAEQRIKSLIPFRDTLSALMTAEQTDTDENRLRQLRANLNRLYDGHVKQFGFINSTGNYRAMKDEPLYPLLRALERDFDPGVSKDQAAKTGKEFKLPNAVKADIFYRRVLGPKKAVTKVETAKEALVVSMNEFGRPYLDYMEGLCGKAQEEITAELAELIFLNPETASWEIADKYLTGNVKGKLAVALNAAAKDSRYKINVEALEQVQPPDLEAVDIGVQLGTFWIPQDIIKEFGTHLFGPDAIQEVTYINAIGKWNVSVKSFAVDATINTGTYGTPDYPGTSLFKAILANTPIKVEREVGTNPETKKPIYKVDDEATAAANQKADEIKQVFLDWIWHDPARRESLVKLYNDRFNTHIPPKYDGSHLDLPGSSVSIALRPHQKDVIWRGIQEGRGLLDHIVGSGKTLASVGIIMESRRMGLMKKAMLMVPNHLLFQWQDAFYSLYPQANILVAGENDFAKANRQKLFASIATGDYDAVIVAHSSFKKIGLPPAMLEKILNEQIDDLTEAISEINKDQAQKRFVKRLEKIRENLKARLESKAQADQKDEAITFDQLGLDALFVDESQEFKNLFISTSLRNVAGLGNLSGSAKAFDLYVKARYLQEKNNEKGLYFLTGTPISNTIAEIYTIQRYMQYDELKQKGLHHFDAWASTFGQVVAGWELDSTGVGFKVNNRFSRFQNVPELIAMYRSFADVITKKDLDEKNGGVKFIPGIKGGKPQNEIAMRSASQAIYMDDIIHRMEHLPRDPSIDNPLKITNDTRKAGLDYRLIEPNAEDFADSKVNLCVNNVYSVWAKWQEHKGTQLIFCDLSTPKIGKGGLKALIQNNGNDDEPAEISMDEILAEHDNFSVYEDIRTKLVAKGIPEHEIKFIHEFKTDLQKAKLFKSMNSGQVRVLIGSTFKMGAGTNVQRLLVAEHNLDAPWRPSDLEQREGRIIRQGNAFFEADPTFTVEIFRYATEKTYDARMWQTIQVKAEGIEQFRRGDLLTRTIDDIAGEAANAAEMKAAATGNELIFTQVRLASELKKLEAVYTNHVRSQHQLEDRIAKLKNVPDEVARDIGLWQTEIKHRDSHTLPDFYFTAAGKTYTETGDQRILQTFAEKMKEAAADDKNITIGKYRGYEISVEATLHKNIQFVLSGGSGLHTPLNLFFKKDEKISIGGLFQRVDNYLNGFEKRIDEALERKSKKAQELDTAQKSLGQPFPQMWLLEALRRDNRVVLEEINKVKKAEGYHSAWVPDSLDWSNKREKEIVFSF